MVCIIDSVMSAKGIERRRHIQCLTASTQISREQHASKGVWTGGYFDYVVTSWSCLLIILGRFCPTLTEGVFSPLLSTSGVCFWKVMPVEAAKYTTSACSHCRTRLWLKCSSASMRIPETCRRFWRALASHSVADTSYHAEVFYKQGIE